MHRPASSCLKLAGPAGAAVLAALLLSPLRATADPLQFQVGEVTIQPTLSDRLRVEDVDWFDPGAGGGSENYTFIANVIRFGSVIDWRDLRVTLEGQEVELWNLPNDAPGLGPGAVYFANTPEENQRAVRLRQAHFRWNNAFTPGLSLAGGRMIVNDGLETTPADPGLAWVKKIRLSQRLIGGFDYTHVGRSFDAGAVAYSDGPWNLTVVAGRPTAGGFEIDANKEVDDVTVAYAALTATEPEWLPRSDLRLFYLYYGDDRDVVVTDNRPLAVRQADSGNLSVHTGGLHLATVQTVGPGDLDAMTWLAAQGGDWESLDHCAWALAIEGGYRFTGVPTKPWLRAGWFRGSGDDNPGDGDHDTFFQVLPTARLYARTPFHNLMNNQDVFLQLVLAPHETVKTRIDWHHLWVTEDADLLYAGGGATHTRPSFGYVGFGAGGQSEIGDVLDFSVDWTPHPRVKLSAYYGHVFGDDVIDGQFSRSSQLDYTYFELTLKL